METAKVTVVGSGPFLDPDWDEADCLCQAKVPTEKAYEFANRVYRERDKKWVWKPWARFHIDCPIHGPRIATTSTKD
jgi:hypothetical protein